MKRRTTYDLAMIREIGSAKVLRIILGILLARQQVSQPRHCCRISHMIKNGKPEFLTVIDESHVTLPQLRAMYAGDQSRKQNLVDFGFRLPSAKDNRPLRYEELSSVSGRLYMSQRHQLIMNVNILNK